MPQLIGDLSGFLAEIRRQAQQHSLVIEEEARKRAVAISADAEFRIQEFSLEMDRKAAKQAELEAGQIRARGELEIRRLYLTHRETLFERVWNEAESRLRALVRSPDYRDVLKRLAFQGARELGVREITLSADPVGHELLTPEELESWSKETGIVFHRNPQPADTWGGLLVSSGRMQCDCSFPTRLAQIRQTGREEVFHRLREPL